MKILNLYAGVGGNRRLWSDEHEITAIENNPHVARIYKDFFPNDVVCLMDAHKYLLEHYKEFDFIWSSRPCKSHSKARFLASSNGDYPPIYPDMKLYEEIIFLQHYFKGKYVVENVKPFYKPLIKPHIISKNAFWSNFIIGKIKLSNRYHFNTVKELQQEKGIDLSKYNGINKVEVLRNCVHPKLGLYIFNAAFKIKQQTLKTGGFDKKI